MHKLIHPPDLKRAAAAIDDFLRALGLPLDADPELRMTGTRVADAFATELLGGYQMDAAEILSETMPTENAGLVVMSDIPATTVCPHHLMPAPGVVHLAYVPNRRVAGFGALARLVHCFSRRLVMQETLTQHIADAMVAHLGATGAGCIVSMVPTCLTSRGNRCTTARASATAYAGTMTHDASLRDEFFVLVYPRERDGGRNVARDTEDSAGLVASSFE